MEFPREVGLFAGAAAAVLLAVVLTACGDDGPGEPSRSTSLTVPATGEPQTVEATRGGAGPSPTPVSPTVASPTSTPAGPLRCQSSGLELEALPAGAAAGTHFLALALTNRGSAPCLISGYPGVSLNDAGGRRLGQPAERNASIPASPIVLDPGQSAHALIALAAHQNFGEGVCSGPSATIVVYPPEQTTAIVVPLEDYVCPGFSVRVFEPGRNEPGR